MIPHVGIDLGTTFSCMCYIGENGAPVVIRNSEGKETTPSVVWFDGKQAYVGDDANNRKIMANAPIYEVVKRDIGKEAYQRYAVNGYDYGPYGISALILKKFRMEAVRYFSEKKWLPAGNAAGDTKIPAVITVPANFGDRERLETKIAGIAAGFDVTAIINEPTAAAMTYGIQLAENKKILVFDLGGGTFDVTIMQVENGDIKVLASDGASQLGGKDWDEVIINYLQYTIEDKTGKEFPMDKVWELNRKAIAAKIQLSEEPQATVSMEIAGQSVQITLHREKTTDGRGFLDGMDDWEDNNFYFEQRSENLLSNVKAILTYMMENLSLGWNDIDDIVIVGGACRMPMIPKMLQELTGRPVHPNSAKVDLDTAIAMGAALYGRNRSRITDVTSKAIGIELEEKGIAIVEHLIAKNTPIPVNVTQRFKAVSNALLKVYEGENESKRPDECVLRGTLELKNPEGEVDVGLAIDFNGMIVASVEANGAKAEIKIKSENGDIDVSELHGRINQVILHHGS